MRKVRLSASKSAELFGLHPVTSNLDRKSHRGPTGYCVTFGASAMTNCLRESVWSFSTTFKRRVKRLSG